MQRIAAKWPRNTAPARAEGSYHHAQNDVGRLLAAGRHDGDSDSCGDRGRRPQLRLVDHQAGSDLHPGRPSVQILPRLRPLGAAVHDSCSALFLSNPEIFRTEKAFLKIDYYKKDNTEYGYIKCDFGAKEPNATVCVDVEIEKFKKIIYGNLFNYN